MHIQVSRVKDAITGSYNGVPFGVTYTKEKYDAMKELEKQAAKVKTSEELNAVLEKFKPLTQESFKELAESKCPYIFINHATGKFYLKLRGRVLKNPMPQVLAERIIKSVEEGIDFTPLIKCWIRFLRLPELQAHPGQIERKGILLANYIGRTYLDQTAARASVLNDGLSQERANELHTRLQTPITEEGLLVTYKVVRELTDKWILDAEGNKKKVRRWGAKSVDENSGIVSYDEPAFIEDRVFEPAIMGTGGDEFSCVNLETSEISVGHIIKVGSYIELDSWDKVYSVDGAFGYPGIHAGNLDYIKGYQSGDTVTLNVFIDPMHIGRFTNEGDGAVIAKKMFIYGAFIGVNRGIYHSSTYAKLNDAEYEQMLTDSLKDYGELIETQNDAKGDLIQIQNSTKLD